MEKKTPLYDRHVALGGKMVPFAGHLLPVQYPAGVIAEHMAVRTAAGLFDVSHMGELLVAGADALKNLNRLLTNELSGMYDGQVRYSPMCNEAGGCVDDLVVYQIHKEAYLVVVNAANRDRDAAWMGERIAGRCELKDLSDGVAQLALQGPNAGEIMLRLAGEGALPRKYYSFIREGDVGGIPCLISRTGYTGELGYELYCAADGAGRLWDRLLEAGEGLGLAPCGLGARDTLRLEAAMPLYGHELDEATTPLEAGLDFAVKLEKEDFIGKTAIAARLPLAKVRVGLEVTGRGIVREGQEVYRGSRAVGRTTSGTHAPFLGRAIAMAYLAPEDAAVGTEVEVDVRGRRIPCRVAALPFYRR